MKVNIYPNSTPEIQLLPLINWEEDKVLWIWIASP
jgi:hypothetical protein